MNTPALAGRLHPQMTSVPIAKIGNNHRECVMATVKRIVLDVLKPHHPNALEFTSAIAERSINCRVKLSVSEVDEKTETVVLVITGEDLQFDAIADVISNMGGSVHSIDEVEVENLARNEVD